MTGDALRPATALSELSVDRLRAICLALPEALEKETWGDPTFRVRDRIFALVRHGDGRLSFWCKAPEGSQMVLVGADPDRFFVPPYVGHKGWVGVRLDHEPDWAEVAALVRRSYRLIAPKRLSARISGMGAAAARKLAQGGFNLAILSSSGKGETIAKEMGGIGVTGSNQSSDDLKRLVDLRWTIGACERPSCPPRHYACGRRTLRPC